MRLMSNARFLHDRMIMMQDGDDLETRKKGLRNLVSTCSATKHLREYHNETIAMKENSLRLP